MDKYQIAQVERLSHCGGTYDYLCDINGYPTYTHKPIPGHTICRVDHSLPLE